MPVHVAGNAVWGNPYDGSWAQWNVGYACPADPDDWYVMGLHWAPDKLTYYLDGVPYHSIAMDEWFSIFDKSLNPYAPFDKSFHLVVSFLGAHQVETALDLF